VRRTPGATASPTCHAAQSQRPRPAADVTPGDGEGQGERAPSRRYLQSESERLRCSCRRCFVWFFMRGGRIIWTVSPPNSSRSPSIRPASAVRSARRNGHRQSRRGDEQIRLHRIRPPTGSEYWQPFSSRKNSRPSDQSDETHRPERTRGDARDGTDESPACSAPERRDQKHLTTRDNAMAEAWGRDPQERTCRRKTLPVLRAPQARDAALDRILQRRTAARKTR
jgi:hypothetical protein